MAQLTQLVGIIELDADPELDTTLDEDIGQTLHRLRSVAPDESDSEAAYLGYCSSDPAWNEFDDTLSDEVVVLKTDLRQLHYELESELARLLDRLFATL